MYPFLPTRYLPVEIELPQSGITHRVIYPHTGFCTSNNSLALVAVDNSRDIQYLLQTFLSLDGISIDRVQETLDGLYRAGQSCLDQCSRDGRHSIFS